MLWVFRLASWSPYVYKDPFNLFEYHGTMIHLRSSKTSLRPSGSQSTSEKHFIPRPRDPLHDTNTHLFVMLHERYSSGRNAKIPDWTNQKWQDQPLFPAHQPGGLGNGFDGQSSITGDEIRLSIRKACDGLRIDPRRCDTIELAHASRKLGRDRGLRLFSPDGPTWWLVSQGGGWTISWR